MKKITLLLFVVIATLNVNAQLTLVTIKSDGFETSDGFPSNFSISNSAAWNTSYTGLFWNNFFNNTTLIPKGDVSSIDITTAHGGSQCIKIAVAQNSVSATTLRLRSNTSSITAPGVWDKQVVTFWAKTDVATSGIALIKNTTITLTDQWQKFIITSNYSTSVTATILTIDFINSTSTPAAPSNGYNVYIDDLNYSSTPAASTSSATEITETGFTANWNGLDGATSYTLTVEKSDGATTPVWTAISGSPFTETTTSKILTGLTSNSTYRYKVIATDGSYFSQMSTYTQAVTSFTTGINKTGINTIFTKDGAVYVPASSSQPITVYNSVGQQVLHLMAKEGNNELKLNKKGVYVVVVGNQSQKIKL